ncbi:hypothetical protein AVEN_96777-1 [Araneus ventricosus]|uniref:Uncharacterized protein n=1 Tax=Araneus ventricosus TaxID=182803 RepID=A0A4Y2IMV9_ARAVE|nr:hypothetical protein AVEN_96777-1 [Araneus ventricosus]
MKLPPVLSLSNKIKQFPSPPKCSEISRFHYDRQRHVWCWVFSRGSWIVHGGSSAELGLEPGILRSRSRGIANRPPQPFWINRVPTLLFKLKISFF